MEEKRRVTLSTDVNDTKIGSSGKPLYQIILHNGKRGGFVQSLENIPDGCLAKEHEPGYGVFGSATVEDKAIVRGHAVVLGNAIVKDNAVVRKHATVCGDAKIYGNAVVRGYSGVQSYAEVYDHATISGTAIVSGKSKIYENARVNCASFVGGDAIVRGDATITAHAEVYEHARVQGNAIVTGYSEVCSNAVVTGDAIIRGCASIGKNAYIRSNNDYICIGPLGSRRSVLWPNPYTTFYKTMIGDIAVSCGCFNGTLEEFKDRIDTEYQGNAFGQEYLTAIQFAEQFFSIKRES